MFCFRQIQTSSVASWIHKHSWTSSGRHTSARQPNHVIDWLLRTTDLDRWNLLTFFIHFNSYFAWSAFSPGSAKADVKWVKRLNSYLIASCVQNIWAKNCENLIIFHQVTIYNVGMFFFTFLCILTHILLDLISLGSAEANTGLGGKLNSRLMASCVRNICIKNY